MVRSKRYHKNSKSSEFQKSVAFNNKKWHSKREKNFMFKKLKNEWENLIFVSPWPNGICLCDENF